METRTSRRFVPATDRKPPCDDWCPGWGVFHVNRWPGIEIERCDECNLYWSDDEATVAVCEWIEEVRPLLVQLAQYTHADDAIEERNDPEAADLIYLINRARTLATRDEGEVSHVCPQDPSEGCPACGGPPVEG
jgi:hypothetical protein